MKEKHLLCVTFEIRLCKDKNGSVWYRWLSIWFKVSWLSKMMSVYTEQIKY